jgi:alpha-amylase
LSASTGEIISEVLRRYIEYMGERISLFDVHLLSNFSRLSFEEDADLRTVFEDSLAFLKPRNAVVGLNDSI